MAFWQVDLTTEDGAMSAAQIGSYACFLAAGLVVFGFAVSLGLLRMGAMMPAVGALMLAEFVIFVIAAFRMRAGKGVLWGVLAMIVLVVELLVKLLGVFSVGGFVINVVLLVGVVTGLRGVRGLQNRTFAIES